MLTTAWRRLSITLRRAFSPQFRQHGKHLQCMLEYWVTATAYFTVVLRQRRQRRGGCEMKNAAAIIDEFPRGRRERNFFGGELEEAISTAPRAIRVWSHLNRSEELSRRCGTYFARCSAKRTYRRFVQGPGVRRVARRGEGWGGGSGGGGVARSARWWGRRRCMSNFSLGSWKKSPFDPRFSRARQKKKPPKTPKLSLSNCKS